MKPFGILSAIALIALLAGCSHKSGTLPPIQTAGKTATKTVTIIQFDNLQRAVPAHPYDPQTDGPISALRRFPNGPAAAVQGPRSLPGTVLGGLHTTSSTSNDLGGQAGLRLNNANSFTGLYANNTGYKPNELTLVTPSAGATNYLYSPTFHPSDNSCLEMSTFYETNSSGTASSNVKVYDFCDPNAPSGTVGVFHDILPIDATFRTNYDRNFGDNLPEYTAEIYALSGTWYALLYNYTSGGWEVRYTRTDPGSPGNRSGSNGWDIFETHYQFATTQTGPCSNVPTTASTGIRYQKNGTWTLITTAVPGAQPYTQGNCFTNDQSGVGYYYTSSWICASDCTDASANLHQWNINSYFSASTSSCQLDSYGYCAVRTSGPTSSGTVSCFDGLHWHNYPATTTSTYNIYGTSGLLETATETITNSDGGVDGCPLQSIAWNPADPSQQYGDPNLP